MRRIDDRDPYEAARSEPFTNTEMQAMSGVSLMTLHLWRQGTPTKAKLSATKDRAGRVRYPVRQTLAWMKRHGIVPREHPDDLAGAPQRKSGPPPGRGKPAAAHAAVHH